MPISFRASLAWLKNLPPPSVLSARSQLNGKDVDKAVDHQLTNSRERQTASIFFSRAFLSSSCFSFSISFGSMPAYFFLQLK